MEGSPGVAIGAAFLWGILSVLLSPCHLSSIPLIVGFVSEQASVNRRKAFQISVLFALGILITIALIGVVTAAMGRMMGDIGKYGNYLMALVFLLVGLHLIGLIPMPWSSGNQTSMSRRGFLAAFILGLLFGIALGPCTFAFMAPILAVSFKIASDRLLYAVTLLLAYGVGHCAVIVLAGTSTGLVQNYLNWSETSNAISIIKKVCGILIIAGSMYIVYVNYF